jgi:hypothetical protein
MRSLEHLAGFEYDMGGTCMDMRADSGHEIVGVDDVLADYRAHIERLKSALMFDMEGLVAVQGGVEQDHTEVRDA